MTCHSEAVGRRISHPAACRARFFAFASAAHEQNCSAQVHTLCAGERSFGVHRDSGAFTAKAELSLRTPRRGRIQTGDWEGVPPCCTRPKAGLRPAVHKANAELREVCLRFFACSNSASRYGVLRMTAINGYVGKCTNVSVAISLVVATVVACRAAGATEVATTCQIVSRTPP